MKLLLIDGSNLIFRAYFATEKQKIVDQNGTPVNAISTLISMINKLISEHKPTHIFMALDSGSATFRHDLYSEYKGKRSETPDNLKVQFSIARELYDSMGIIYSDDKKFEADDLIATYATNAANSGTEVLVVSGDKDLLQLVGPNIRVLTPAMGFAKEVNYNEDVFVEKFEFTPDRFIEYKALVGDSSDNIIGIAGLGDKTARKMIQEFGTLEDIFTEAIDGGSKKKVWNNLADNIEQVKTNLELVTLIRDVELEYDFSALEFVGYNYDTFLPFLQKCNFSKFYSQFTKDVEVKAKAPIINLIDENFKFDNQEIFIIPVYGKSRNYIIDSPIGFGLRQNNINYFYPIEANCSVLIELLNSNVPKVLYDAKAIFYTLKTYNYNNIRCDLYLAAALINPDNYKKNLEVVGFERGISNNQNLSFNTEKTIYQETLDNTSILLTIANKIFTNLSVELEGLNMSSVLFDIELPLAATLAKMEDNGVNIDVEQLNKIKIKYKLILDNLEKELKMITDFNFSSPKQLSEYLFEEKNLPTKGIKKNTNGYSTDVVALQKVIDQIGDSENEDYIFIKKILEFRKYKKILSTYVEGIEKHISNGKVHPITHQLLADTGRLSSADPNVQNIPIKSEEGKIIRSLFNSGDYKHFVSIDYSQVELRIIAHIANEQNMINDFNSGLDIHEETAKKILNKTEVSHSERNKAKAINFGIIYGMSKYGLAKQVGITVEEADIFIDRYFKTYPGILNYMEKQIMSAKNKGYVVTEYGRVRHVPGINSNAKMQFEAATRVAINTPIQGTAADIIKIAMNKIHEYINSVSEISMAIQIHDELVFYMNDLIHVEKIEQIMREVTKFEVVLDVESGIGTNWLECK